MYIEREREISSRSADRVRLLHELQEGDLRPASITTSVIGSVTSITSMITIITIIITTTINIISIISIIIITM